MYKYVIFAIALLLGCLALPAVEKVQAGTSCHGAKKKVAQPVAVEVDQEVTVSPGVTVKEKVVVDEPSGKVVVTEEVDINEGGSSGGPATVHGAKKAARRAKRATIAEAKAERRAARAAQKEAEAEFEAGAEEAVKNAYSK